MSPWRNARAWAPALVALACLLGFGYSWLDPVPRSAKAEPRRAPQASAEARALLGGLAVGERLMGWTVQAVDGPLEGVLRVDLGRDDVRFALTVAPKDARPERAPVETERYAIFYSDAHPPGTALPDGTIRATTHALARRIRANEATVEVPGL
jgi:hypothetical protein